jgi:hypothetical protein
MAKQYTNAERAQNYDETNFNKIFEEYDEDKNVCEKCDDGELSGNKVDGAQNNPCRKYT